MNTIISYIANQGVSEQVLAYILLAPLVATLIVFLRQVVGLKSLGVYHPLLLAFAFVGAGLREGLFFFLLIVLLANAITYLVKKFPLLYLPRLTIVVTVTALSLLLVISIIRLSDYRLTLSDYFPIIIILALSDKLVTAQMKRNAKPALIMTGSTLAIALLGYLILNINWLQSAVLSYPLIFLLTIIVINIFLGRFRGLRLNELWRFRHLLKLPPRN
jgi:hypothetical protein